MAQTAATTIVGDLAGPAAVFAVRRDAANGSAARRRVIAGVVALGCAGILSMAGWMTPSAMGLGTHSEMLNLPPCGWIMAADIPCPTCGMTTAFAHAANGDLLSSFLAQPLGCGLAIATAMALLMSLYVLVTGSRVAGMISRLWGRWSAWGVSAAVVTAWGYKVATYKGWT